MKQSYVWSGLSGSEYTCLIYPVGECLPMWGGIFLMCSRNESGWQVSDMGHCEELAEEVVACPSATHIHIWLCCDPKTRERAVKDIQTKIKLTGALTQDPYLRSNPVIPITQSSYISA